MGMVSNIYAIFTQIIKSFNRLYGLSRSSSLAKHLKSAHFLALRPGGLTVTPFQAKKKANTLRATEVIAAKPLSFKCVIKF